LTGWAPKGERLPGKAPFGHWNTSTFIAALRHDRIDAPWVFDGPINGEIFRTYVEKVLVPTLRPGDVVVMDNLGSHKSAPASFAGVGRHGGRLGTGTDDRNNNPINDRINESPDPSPKDGLNPRQRWYLKALVAGKEVRATDLQRHWGVSEKTARRDVAALKDRGVIEFVGPLRTGRYRLSR